MISILKTKKYLLILPLIFIITILPVNAQTTPKPVNIYFFHSNNCSHCQSEIKFLNKLEKKYQNIKIYRYEIHEKENNNNRIKIQKLYNLKTTGVPLTIIGDTPYLGYLDEKSPITFIKTIEYYSKYGYKDQVSNILKINQIPEYIPTKNAPTLEEFMKTYGNYKLIGKIYTDNLDISSNALVLGVLSQFNPIKVITTIIILILISKIHTQKTELYLLTLFFLISILLNTNYIISNNIYTTITIITLFLLTIINIIKYKTTNQKKYIYNSLIIIIALLSSYLENIHYQTYSTIFKSLLPLHNLNTIDKISYYGNYLTIILIINIIIIIIIYNLKVIINEKRKNIPIKY